MRKLDIGEYLQYDLTMTQDDVTLWDQAGLGDEQGHGLTRRFGADYWLVPRTVELVRDRLCWPKDWTNEAKNVRPGPGLLIEFLSLGDGTPEQVRTFANRWGVLEVCKHGLPASHSFPASGLMSFKKLQSVCLPLESAAPRGFYEESISLWRKYASQAKALLNLAACVHLDRKRNPNDWRMAWEIFDQLQVSEEKGYGWSLRESRYWIAHLVQRWLRIGAVVPKVEWNDQHPSVLFGSVYPHCGLFGALGIQLMLVVSRAEGLAFCSACGTAYIPKRKPAAGRRSFCRSCGKKAAWRLAQRASRATPKRKRITRLKG